jgi:hypothetical protein
MMLGCKTDPINIGFPANSYAPFKAERAGTHTSQRIEISSVPEPARYQEQAKIPTTMPGIGG